MDYSKRIQAVRKTIDGHRKHLYTTLGAIYAFRMEAWEDNDDDYVKFAKAEYEKRKWSWTEATKSNKFLSAVRLAFESDEDSKERNAAPASKYAGALAWASHKNTGNTAKNGANKPKVVANCATLAADFLEKAGGVVKCHNNFKALKTPGGSGDNDKFDRAVKKLAQINQAKVELDDAVAKRINHGDKGMTDDGYMLLLAKVDQADNTKFSIIEKFDWDKDRIEKQIGSEFGKEGPKKKAAAKNAAFTALYNIVRLAEAVPIITHSSTVGKTTTTVNAGRAITINNNTKGAKVHVSLVNEKKSVVANADMGQIGCLPTGTFVIYRDEQEAIRHLWSAAQEWDWSFEKKGTLVDGKKLANNSLVVTGPTVGSRQLTVSAFINANKNDKGKYAKRDGIDYSRPCSLVVEFLPKLMKNDDLCANVNHGGGVDCVGFAKAEVKEYLGGKKAHEISSGFVSMEIEDAELMIHREDDSGYTAFDLANKAASNSGRVFVKNSEVLKGLRSLVDINADGIEIGIQNRTVVLRTVDPADDAFVWSIYVPQQTPLGYDGLDIQILEAA